MNFSGWGKKEHKKKQYDRDLTANIYIFIHVAFCFSLLHILSILFDIPDSNTNVDAKYSNDFCEYFRCFILFDPILFKRIGKGFDEINITYFILRNIHSVLFVCFNGYIVSFAYPDVESRRNDAFRVNWKQWKEPKPRELFSIDPKLRLLVPRNVSTTQNSRNHKWWFFQPHHLCVLFITHYSEKKRNTININAYEKKKNIPRRNINKFYIVLLLST